MIFQIPGAVHLSVPGRDISSNLLHPLLVRQPSIPLRPATAGARFAPELAKAQALGRLTYQQSG